MVVVLVVVVGAGLGAGCECALGAGGAGGGIVGGTVVAGGIVVGGAVVMVRTLDAADATRRSCTERMPRAPTPAAGPAPSTGRALCAEAELATTTVSGTWLVAE